MSTIHLFANDTAPTGPELDGNFTVFGTLTPIPCVTSGTNTLALTVNASGVTVPQYNQYQQYTSVAVSSNTGAVTAAVGSLSPLNVYKDTPAGPAALTGNEIIANCRFVLMYDSALNTGSGGFHLISNGSGLGSYLPLSGGSLSGPLTGTTFTGTTFSATDLIVGGGQGVLRIQSTLASVTFTAINPQTTQDQGFSLAGVKTNDNIMVGLPAGISAGIAYQGFVNGAGSITLRAMNITSGTITPSGGNYRLTALGFT